jgi:hypothetical protein
MQSHAADAAIPAENPDFQAILAISAVGALASLIVTGCLVGVRNDLYFLPILGALYDLPQFANDTFIQSLRHYASGPWMLLSGLGNHVPVSALSLTLGFFSRWLAFFGFGLCATLLGAHARKEQILFAFLLCATSLLRGQSWAGDGGLFINYFTHSELANGLTLIFLYALMRQHLVLACVLEGLIFFDNAFIGVWDGVMAVAVVAVLVTDGRLRMGAVIRRVAIGAIPALLLAAPVLLNILHNPDFGKTPDFDYVAFLEEFWPYHFIFRDTPLSDKLNLALLVVLGFGSFALLGRQGRPFSAALAALLGLYAIGIILPAFTHSPTILNLHLLRDSTILQLLAVLAALTLAVRWWFSDRPACSRALGPLLAIMLCIPMRTTTFQPVFHLAIACSLLFLSTRENLSSILPVALIRNPRLPRLVAIALIVIGFGVIAASNWVVNMRATNWIAEWERAGLWAKEHTAPDAVFLMPTWYFRGEVGRTEPGSVRDAAVLNAGTFQYSSQRRVWVDFRNGAAVMWFPSYYDEWRRKVVEVNRLTGPDQEAAYARKNGITYIIDVCSAGKPGTLQHATERLCIFSIS